MTEIDARIVEFRETMARFDVPENPFRERLETLIGTVNEAVGEAISAYDPDPDRVFDKEWPDWLKLLASLRIVDWHPLDEHTLARGLELAAELGLDPGSRPISEGQK